MAINRSIYSNTIHGNSPRSAVDPIDTRLVIKKFQRAVRDEYNLQAALELEFELELSF